MTIILEIAIKYSLKHGSTKQVAEGRGEKHFQSKKK